MNAPEQPSPGADAPSAATRTVQVALGPRSYSIEIGAGTLGNDSPFWSHFPSTDPSIHQRKQNVQLAKALLYFFVGRFGSRIKTEPLVGVRGIVSTPAVPFSRIIRERDRKTDHGPSHVRRRLLVP